MLQCMQLYNNVNLGQERQLLKAYIMLAPNQIQLLQDMQVVQFLGSTCKLVERLHDYFKFIKRQMCIINNFFKKDGLFYVEQILKKDMYMHIF